MRNDLTITHVMRILELYQKIKKGSNIFWEELESLLIKNSSNFKTVDKDVFLRTVLVLAKNERQSDTLCKILSNIYLEFEQ